MRVVVGHVNGDFDSVAATYAASKLYPGAVRALPGPPDPRVREFLRLYGEALDFQSPEALDLGRVTLLVVVDTQVPRRLGPFAEVAQRAGVEVHLYDHHPESPDALTASKREVRPVGSTTTILVGHMRRRGLRLEPWEATLLALGIYWDTGCLTFRSTTPEDLEAAGWLLKQGANLDVIHDFAQRPLEAEQRVYLDRLAEGARYLDLDGVVVLLSAILVGERVEGLGKICERLCDEEGVDAAIAVVGARGEVAVSARARTDAIDLGGLLSKFGGGGHKRAASAVVRGGKPSEVAERIEELLPKFLTPPVRARDIMSSPVRTVTPGTTVEDALKVMLRYGHNGLIVVEGEEVVGIVTRGDLDRARRLGHGDHPVAEYMSTEVISVEPDAPLDRIRRIMVEGDVGRLPVMDRGKLVGIVTRTDVLRALHGMGRPRPQGPPDVPVVRDVRAELKLRLPSRVYRRLREAGEIAWSSGEKAFAVGGFVRDLLLGARNYDLDIAVEGDAIRLAKECAQRWGGEVISHERFGTAKVKLPSGEVVDFATCRAEFYERPAVLPQVERASIREDLYRRDFTINAMAICIWPEEFGRLWDYFGGLNDLRNKRIRVLHNLSFVEDPTRILRAARYEQRLGFRLERQTERLLRQAVEQGLLSLVSADRIRGELLRSLSEQKPARVMRRLEELGVLKEIHPPWSLGQQGLARLRRVPRAISWFERAVGRRVKKPYLVALCASIQGLLPSERESLLRSLRFPSDEQQVVVRATDAADQLLPRSEEFSKAKPSEVYRWLEGLPDEALAYLGSLLTSPGARARIAKFAKEWAGERPLISGEDLKALGLQPGPSFGRILRQVLLAQLDGRVSSREEAIRLAEELAREGEGCS